MLVINDSNKNTSVKSSMRATALQNLNKDIANTYKYSDIIQNDKILSNTYY